MAYGDLKVRNLIWNTGSGDNTVVLSTLATQSYVTTNFAPKNAPTFTGTINGADLILSGNLTVSGTQTIINTNVLQVEDKHIEIGKVSSPSDTTADGGGIILKASSDRTFVWINSTDAWTSSEHIQVASGKTFIGDGSTLTALNATNLASGTVPTARLGTGTAGSSNFLRGDGSWQVVATDLVADTTPQLGGNLDVNTKNIIFGDSADGTTDDVLKFGAGTDLSIYSDGTKGMIETPNNQILEFKGQSGGNAQWIRNDSFFVTPGLNVLSNVKLNGQAGTSGQVLTSGGSGSTSWTTISAAPEATGTISGTLPDGKAVIVNSDGTLSEAGLDGPNYSSTGTDVVTDTYLGEVCSAPMRGNRIIVVWNSNGTSNYGGKACIGSINPSNRTISFGSVATVPSSGDYNNFQYPDVFVYDHANYGEMAIVSWWHESNGGPKWNILTCPAGDTSTSAPTWTTQGASGYGNSKFGRSMTKLNNRLIITFNSGNYAYIKALEVGNQQFQSAGSSYNYATYVKTAKIASATSGAGLIVYDRAAQEELNLRPFTSSSNTISLQTNQEETSENNITIDSTWATPNYNFIGITKFPLISGSNYIYGIQFRKTSGSVSVVRAGLVSVTASGSGVSQTSRVTVATNTILNGGFYNDPTFDTDGNLVCHWSDGTSSSASKTAYASLSGSGAASNWTIGSFSTPASISTSSLAGQTTVQLSMTNGTGAVVVTYNDGADNNYGKSFVRTGIVTNVTTDNYLGYSDGAFTNGQTGKVKVVGNIVTGLSGLTAGSKMYLQNNGTLSTTAASPSVVAGLALSSTKLLIKG
jgi:hypothetical protein